MRHLLRQLQTVLGTGHVGMVSSELPVCYRSISVPEHEPLLPDAPLADIIEAIFKVLPAPLLKSNRGVHLPHFGFVAVVATLFGSLCGQMTQQSH